MNNDNNKIFIFSGGIVDSDASGIVDTDTSGIVDSDTSGIFTLI